MWEALQQMVYPMYRHKISDTDQLQQVLVLTDSLAQVSQDTLNPAIDQLPKRLMTIWLSRQSVVMLNFVWTNHNYVLDVVLVLQYFECKLRKTHASSSNLMQFWEY